jgi:hypothetical protein
VFAAGVDREQRIERKPVEQRFGGVGREERIERVGRTLRCDAQRAAVRRGRDVADPRAGAEG